LMYSQIETEANNLLEMALGELLGRYLEWMQQENHLRVRMLPDAQQTLQSCYYSKSLYYEEECAAVKMRSDPHFSDNALRSYFPRYQAASGSLMDS
jgi:hypothetical protein